MTADRHAEIARDFVSRIVHPDEAYEGFVIELTAALDRVRVETVEAAIFIVDDEATRWDAGTAQCLVVASTKLRALLTPIETGKDEVKRAR
jgi:hypothetical protein